MKRNWNIAALFGVVGGIYTAALTLIVVMVNGFSGMGDGSSSAIYNNPYSYAPLSAYFLMGVIGALTKHPKVRMATVTLAHVLPMCSFVFIPLRGIGFVITVLLVTYLVYVAAWIRLLKEI